VWAYCHYFIDLWLKYNRAKDPLIDKHNIVFEDKGFAYHRLPYDMYLLDLLYIIITVRGEPLTECWVNNLRDGHSCQYIKCNQFRRLTHSRSLSSSIKHQVSCDCVGACRGTISWLPAHNSFQNLVYRYLRSCTTKVTQDSWPTIIVALVTIIVKMKHGECCILTGIHRRWRRWLQLTITKSHINILTYSPKNSWRFVDPHFATGLSTLCNYSLWHWTSITVFWPFYPLHVCFYLSLHCFLIVDIYIAFKI